MNSNRISSFTVLLRKLYLSTLIIIPCIDACAHGKLTGKVVLGKSSFGDLCTLMKVIDDNKIELVARSYDGKDWETFFANSSEMNFSCNDLDCSTTLSSIDIKYHYKITKVSHSLSRDNQIARFLEQSTFGATRKDLTEFDTSAPVDDNIANWIKDQTDNKKMTLHREWFRLRANHRFETNHIARIYHPCETKTRYRRYAFTSKDFKKYIEIKKVKGKLKLLIGGFTRTIVESLDWYNDDHARRYGPLKPGTYMICQRPVDCLNCTLSILDPIAKKCESLMYNGIYGNPPVNFFEHIEVPENLIQIRKDFVTAINEQRFPNGIIQEFMVVKELVSTSCQNVAKNYGDAPVFGLHLGSNEYYIHDPPPFLLNNTLSTPLADGGSDSKSLTGSETLCSNAPMTFLNSDDCQLSTEPTTCGPTSVGPNTVVCGSIGEVSNDPSLGGCQGYGGFDLMAKENSTTWGPYLANQRKIVWTMISLHAEDQLRQRMAWALSQIFAISAPDVSTNLNTEMQTMYYDIFVRNAFGNYRNILKETSYTVMMGDSLSFKNSRSTSYNWERFGKFCHPDENFSREIMQLFSVGPCKLKIDGTPVLAKDGCVPTYTNDDIAEYARAWTGFTPRELRGNIEAENGYNHIDPMRIEIEWRDMFPKMGMDGKYIGDKYPRCSDRPGKHFLKKGARYILLGRTSSPSEQYDPIEWEDDPNTKRVILEKPSKSGDSNFLYTHLCNPDNQGNCQYRTTVELTSDLNCIGEECEVDTVRVVQVNSGIFFEYIQHPCVEQAFYKNAVKLGRRWSDKIVCADQTREIASSACCESKSPNWSDAERSEIYWGERMSFKTAASRCQKLKRSTCKFPSLVKDCVIDGETKPDCLDQGYYWTEDSCNLKVKVDPANGNCAIVHSINSVDNLKMASHVQENTLTFFRVHWKNNKYPKPSNNCGNSKFCTILNGMCLCEVSVKDNKVFKRMPKSAQQVLNKLNIGAYDPELLNLKYKTKQKDIILHHVLKKKKLKTNTVFEVQDNFGVTHYLLNVESIVSIKGTKPKYSFRNPPQFLSIHDPEIRDAQFETEATIDHYFYHENTAPFVARKLINRFQISNPSPSFIKRVATAFYSGIYQWESLTFGSNKYGDLHSTIAAILLDDESRSVVLDADPSHGSFREPIQKILSFMRSMEFEADDDKPLVDFDLMEEKIGQMAYEMDSVFSFFLSDYKLSNDASLFAPEAQRITGPNIIGTLNGLFSLIKWGSTDYWDGFFNGRGGRSKIEPGDFSTSVGRLTFEPSNKNPRTVVEELSTLLTSGRLSSENKEIILDAYNQEPNKTAALMIVQQLITTTAEFHTTALVSKSGASRPAVEPPTPSMIPYKAVIFLVLKGGLDSFNMLIPGCNPYKSQYINMRQQIALTDDQLIPLSVRMPPLQPCTIFNLHHKLQELKQSYDQGRTLFFVNTGVLTEELDQTNYKTLSKLFAHNLMQEEIQRIDNPSTKTSTGVIGRMLNALSKLKYNVGSISIVDRSTALVGEPGETPIPIVVQKQKSKVFDPYPWNERREWNHVDLMPVIQNLNNATTAESLFAESWSNDLLRSIEDSKIIDKALNNAEITEKFTSYDYSDKLKQVASLIQTAEIRGKDRDAFYVEFGGWDHHVDLENLLSLRFEYLNRALGEFWRELENQRNADKVVLIAVSEFARTLTPNTGDGSDHGWGGHYFMMGGSNVKGGRIMGEYPDLEGEQNVDGGNGRGRFIPSLSWDAIWNAVGQWMGVDDEKILDEILPNRKKSGSVLFNKDDLFNY